MGTTSKPFARHGASVRAIGVFPDGNEIVTAGDDGALRVWDIRGGQRRAEYSELDDRVLAVGVTERRTVFACGRGGTISWDADNGTVTSTAHPIRVTAAAISQDGRSSAVVTREGSILRPDNGDSWRTDQRRIDSIAVTANGAIVTAGSEPLVLVTDQSGTRQDGLDGRANGDVAAACSTEGSCIAYRTRDGVYCWRREQAGRPMRLAGCDDAVTVAVTPDGKQVIAGDFDGGIWAWTLDGPTEPLRMPGHDKPVRSLAVTPDCKQLISGADDGTIRIWDLTTAAEIVPGSTPSPQPGLTSDEPSTTDLLGFADDVHGLAKLITDRETEPPLAIALLGRWGSGKSSFLRQLENRITSLAKQGRTNPARSVYATAVRQIRFDAWHYNDDHLWVGIIEHLFAGLAHPERPDVDGVRAGRDSLRRRLRELETLAERETSPRRRLRARLRLWSGNLAQWRDQLTWAGGAVVLLAATAGLMAWLSHGAVLTWLFNAMTWVCGALATMASWPVLDRVVTAWTTDREFGARRTGRLDQAVREARIRLARLDAAQRLALAVEQARSGRYDRYRGLLGQVHADLRELSDAAQQAFDEWDQADTADRARAAGSPPIERVILYIDDLDRCSPRTVVDVLAAVHLLLALPLFVVVVAVDPRWLRRCLEQHYTELFGTRSDKKEVATPLDYLDKVFQVVFSLRPMGAEAERFVADLAPTRLPAQPAATLSPNAAPSGSRRRSTEQSDAVATGASPPTPPHPQPEKLRLRADELEFIQRLHPLLETPRAVKRFVNLYRLVRATIAEDKLDEFIGVNGTGPYRVVLALLAVLVSAPDGCRRLIGTLRETEDREATITQVLDQLVASEQSSRTLEVWTRLRDVVHSGNPLEYNLSTYRYWAGTIARFSFETWDLTEAR